MCSAERNSPRRAQDSAGRYIFIPSLEGRGMYVCMYDQVAQDASVRCSCLSSRAKARKRVEPSEHQSISKLREGAANS